MDIVQILLLVLVIAISVTIHEAMHAYASYWLGDQTARIQGRLSLNPLKHIDPFLTLLLPLILALVGAPIFGAAKPVPFNPYNLRGGEWGMALVALAGPLINLLLAFVSFGVWSISGMPYHSILDRFLTLFVTVNLGFFVFNMLPLPPLDGSRLLYVFAPDFLRKFMDLLFAQKILIQVVTLQNFG